MITDASLTQNEANRLYTLGNNQGLGYNPCVDFDADDTVESAVTAALAGTRFKVVLRPQTTSDVYVLVNTAAKTLIAIGGDAQGRGAWAVPISRVASQEEETECTS